jgi:PAP_fibrillin
VDTSNRVVQQIFDMTTSSVYNRVELDFGIIGRAGGTFTQSSSVANRAIVSFNEASITFTKNGGFVIDLGWIFSIIGTIRNSKDNGWLETTFLDSDMRIGRGNKGTMFILTRDRDAVQP